VFLVLTSTICVLVEYVARQRETVSVAAAAWKQIKVRA